MYSVFKFEIHAEAIVLVAGDAAVAASEGSCRNGMYSACEPEEDVDVVDVLLNDMVA